MWAYPSDGIYSIPSGHVPTMEYAAPRDAADWNGSLCYATDPAIITWIRAKISSKLDQI